MRLRRVGMGCLRGSAPPRVAEVVVHGPGLAVGAALAHLAHQVLAEGRHGHAPPHALLRRAPALALEAHGAALQAAVELGHAAAAVDPGLLPAAAGGVVEAEAL